ncbi:Hypothetical predicted protein [Xyrichtys novacula]|uniref:Uncharacterized protein n=1 Tax=Xyrichtys novacula TaxID=13765 RepID=A0AAV1EY74_XYRNO|nr:Hypothetical predicted protein [Xyrichtys novacula]
MRGFTFSGPVSRRLEEEEEEEEEGGQKDDAYGVQATAACLKKKRLKVDGGVCAVGKSGSRSLTLGDS